ncbi:ATP-binding protein [Streptomyces daliensis]|uniref:ATP-binding protein n=1 Tax=Streptomyces daliensis TaxID=299421 RepID=A0A8T4IKY2_9ACTN|nr:ATP-binding protein [Streptomyces daliensis]
MPNGVRVTVSDTSQKLPVLQAPDWTTECGRGLLLLELMADAWGSVPTATGKDVWFEMRLGTMEVAA